MAFNPVILPPGLFDRAQAARFDMAGYVKSQPIPTVSLMSTRTYLGANPIERMNRRQRRAKMRELGITPAQARAAAKRRAQVEEVERKALGLMPAQARR